MSITSKALWSSLISCFLVAASWGWFSAPEERQDGDGGDDHGTGRDEHQ